MLKKRNYVYMRITFLFSNDFKNFNVQTIINKELQNDIVHTIMGIN